jgi:hypothetical protein
MEYEILNSMSTYGLNDQVSKKLKDGWVLHGSPFVFGNMICQAMTKGYLHSN